MHLQWLGTNRVLMLMNANDDGVACLEERHILSCTKIQVAFAFISITFACFASCMASSSYKKVVIIVVGCVNAKLRLFTS